MTNHSERAEHRKHILAMLIVVVIATVGVVMLLRANYVKDPPRSEVIYASSPSQNH